MEGWRPFGRAVLALLVLGGLVSAQVRGRAGAPGSAGSVPVPEPELDNVLILVGDDLGIDMVGVYGLGSDPAPTPNIDQLAASGVLFRNAWSQPICSPTRATIQTGRLGFRTTIGMVIPPFGGGAALPLEEITLPEMLDLGTGARYAHAAIGKWHLGTSQVGGNLAPNLAGYSHFAGSVEGQIHAYDFWTRVVDGSAATVTGYNTSVNVDDALDWIGQQTKPWLCYVAFQAPHAPYHRPPSGLHTQVLPPGDPRASCTDTTGNDPYPYYKAMVEAMDTEIGRLLAGIAPDELERTTVIFLGDNGGVHCLSPDPNKAKGTLYEGGVHVPFIVAGSKVRNSGECQALVTACDVFATVAEIAGVDLEQALPGVILDSVSVVPYLRLPDRPSIRDVAIAETFSPNGVGNPAPLMPCPDRSPYCQANFGFDGPGTAALTICGVPLYGLYGANVVPVQIFNAPPNASATLRIGTYSPAFNVQYGATMISGLPSDTINFQTDALGKVNASIWTGDHSEDRHYQAVVADPSQPSGYTVSNAVRIDLLWTDMLAARNERYKLIRFNPCEEELYDLAADPTELTNLLLSPLGQEELVAYDELAFALDTLR